MADQKFNQQQDKTTADKAIRPDQQKVDQDKDIAAPKSTGLDQDKSSSTSQFQGQRK